MNRIFLVATLIFIGGLTQPYQALAACTTYTTTSSDGTIRLCTRCCTSGGVCDEHCF